MPSAILTIIAPTTPPPTIPRTQRHEPRSSAGYREYRKCLRWDAGFTCCYCLIHESDLSTTGVEGTGLTSIEHIEPQSHAPDRINIYTNCAYACRFCNNTRRDQPTLHPSGARLLDPWRDSRGQHFVLHDDRLIPRYDDDRGRDARYTETTYRLNDRRKIELRRQRRAHLGDRLRLFRHDLGSLRKQAMSAATPAARTRLLAVIEDLQKRRRLAQDELEWRRAIPADAPMSCRCADAARFALPEHVPTYEVRMGM